MISVVRLRRLALDSGAAGFGVCSAVPFTDAARTLEERKRAGMNGTLRFTYADPDRAADPAATFPWSRRLIVLAHAYLPAAGSPGAGAANSGRVARFATEDHYRGLRSCLAVVANELRRLDHRAEILMDDNRLIDRAAAVRAGVGWWGKSAMVLVPGAGPWVLLGSVITDADLETSVPMRRDCGSCTACIPACPTGAIIAPGVLDARRCLAHWLQAPGLIPRELRPAVADRIYGCDDCLDACPPGGRLLDLARPQRGRHDLIELLAQDDQSLLATFTHFYVPGRRARHLRRNILVALGNVGDATAFNVVAGYCGHPDWLLRAHATWAIGSFRNAAANAVLRAVAARENDPRVIEEADHWLERVPR